MGYALTISYSMSGMQLVNNVDHRNLETLWVPGNGVNALWALNKISPGIFVALERFCNVTDFLSLTGQI